MINPHALLSEVPPLNIKYCATGKENIFLFSCTKPMTVACVLHLVEEEKLSLDDDIIEFLYKIGAKDDLDYLFINKSLPDKEVD